MDMDADEFCWICLDDASKGQLMNPCRCPRKVHPTCLARWQLQQAGRAEETQCRFCNSQLADWKASLTPEPLKPEVERVQPIMVVYFEGEIHRIPVKQGNEGLHEFTSRIRDLFRLPEDVDISLTFGCKEPMSGQHLKLEGIGAFDAAVHCASVAAAERQQKLRSTGGGAGALGGDGGSSSSSALDPGGSSHSSQLSSGGASSSGGSTVSSASAPSAAPATAHQQRTANYRPSTYLRHSTGSSWPPMDTSAATDPPEAEEAVSPAAFAPEAEMQVDGHHTPDVPSPFMRGAPSWACPHRRGSHLALAAPLLLDEHLLLQQHLGTLSPSYYSPQDHYLLPDGSTEHQVHHHQPQFNSLGSHDLLAPGTPTHAMHGVHARHATPLPSLLSTPSLNSHFASRIPSAFHGHAALSADNLMSAASGHAAGSEVQAHHPQAAYTRHGMEEACEHSSPSVSMEGASGISGHAPAHSSGAAPVASARRARRSSSHIEEPLPLPPHYAPAHDEGEAESAGMEYHDAASAEAMAWAASFTGRLRCSLKALSRKLVRTINTGLFTHQRLPHGAMGPAEHATHSMAMSSMHGHPLGECGESAAEETEEEMLYRLHEDAMRYSAIPEVHQQQYAYLLSQQQQQHGGAPDVAGH